MRTAIAGVVLLVTAWGAAAVEANGGRAYVDARLYPNQTAGWERFRAAEARLVRGFDQVCGDTYCEGEYHNLQALRFRCSVDAATGHVGECLWTFTGSTARVDMASGRIQVDAQTWACRLPLAGNTPLSDLLGTLEGEDPLHAPLPGTRDSIYEGLTVCL